jgi:hypothetical protein
MHKSAVCRLQGRIILRKKSWERYLSAIMERKIAPASVQIRSISAGQFHHRFICGQYSLPTLCSDMNSGENIEMSKDLATLDELQQRFKDSMEEWIVAIKKEEDLATVEHSIAKVDEWEQAGFEEEDARVRVKRAKKLYEAALRKEFFDI